MHMPHRTCYCVGVVGLKKMAVSKLVVLVGAVLLLHAGYSAVER